MDNCYRESGYDMVNLVRIGEDLMLQQSVMHWKFKIKNWRN